VDYCIENGRAPVVVRLDCGHDQVIDHDNVLHNNAVGSWRYSKFFYRNLLSHQLHNDPQLRLSAHPHGDSQNEEALQDLPYIEWPRLASFIRLSTRPSAITQGFFFGCHLLIARPPLLFLYFRIQNTKLEFTHIHSFTSQSSCFIYFA